MNQERLLSDLAALSPVKWQSGRLRHSENGSDPVDWIPVATEGRCFTSPLPGYDETNIMFPRAGTTLKPEQLRETDKNPAAVHCITSKGTTQCPN